MNRPATARSMVVAVVAVTVAGLHASVGGLTTEALAQGGPENFAAAVSVTGTSTLIEQRSPGVSTLDDGVLRVRDNVLVTVEDASDPRVSGRAVITVNFDAYPHQGGLVAQVRFGTMRLENENGFWEGRFTGRLTDRGFSQTYWLDGEGDYEGLSYVVTAGGSGPVWQSQGLIFPGTLPPMGGPGSIDPGGRSRDRPST